MARFVLTRLVQSLAALAILSVVVFILARATGDPLQLILPMSASEEDYANARQYLGLDRPYVEQYGVTHLICRLFFPGMPHSHIMRELELIAREVRPAFA